MLIVCDIDHNRSVAPIRTADEVCVCQTSSLSLNTQFWIVIDLLMSGRSWRPTLSDGESSESLRLFRMDLVG